MIIRKACPEDRGRIRLLAERLELDYPAMENDTFWMAEEGGRTAGIVGRLEHPDCRELVALGVDPGLRSRGLGRRLVEALVAETPGAVYLATVIPEFFARCGFAVVPGAPAGMAKDPAWCEGCAKEKCTIMVRTSR
jgi:N-acetylglutamate synthase-like GNAT family acetyltransferase